MSVSFSNPPWPLPLSSALASLCLLLPLAVLTMLSTIDLTHFNTVSSLDYLLKPTRTVIWPLDAATLSVTGLTYMLQGIETEW